MQTGAYLVTAAIGGLLALQVGLNAVMRSHTGTALSAALVNFVIGSVALAAVLFATRMPLPTGAQLAGAPWWAWLAGLGGAAYVASSAVLGPLIGGAAFLACVVAGQMAGSLLLDHYGWIGFPERPLTTARLIGAALVVAGVVLLARE
ncbi:MAG: DMT family transporter [Steroidobacteraceae bacterium]|jgi:transporter family-2 protein|nr:DMT family transporter [Steroidobacteraceae bacterium]